MSVTYSMTGYASLRGSTKEQLGFTLSIKSVNHRFLDLQFRMPSLCDGLEMQLRRVLKEKLQRGHVDVTLQLERKGNAQVQLNAPLLDAYLRAFREASAEHDLTGEPDLNSILRLPGLMVADSSLNEEALEGLDESVLALIDELIERLNEGRAKEGEALVAELRWSMQRLEAAAAEVAELRSEVRQTLFDRLRARLAELTENTSVTEERLLAEAAVLAEKSDVEEEIVRLRTHIGHFIALLDAGGELGKRLDFLLQELNREANTMLSKTSSASGTNGLRITELGLEMKAEIEKAREQVQNLE
ncbi:MAG TPA: YicC/YloC family endoribonuclease [Edaphobacter sp.]|nr:YicC/YloC family endoribonuclease [Edaphobacter sp.]